MARTIKRYGNRKLYDVAASAYVSLEDVAALIRGGETVEVLDNVTGDDITAQTLTQVVLEEGKRGKSVLPTELLHDLLRRGGRAFDAGAGLVRHGVDELVQGSLGRITRALQGPQTQELRQLRAQLTELEGTLARILDAQEGAGRAPGADEKTHAGPTTNNANGVQDEHAEREQHDLPPG